jgi:hypothetical protein
MGMMYEISDDVEILNRMITWTDQCVSQRNDFLPAHKGGQRVMWTGKIEKVWCPEAPTAKNAKYSGCESEDTIAHIAYCAKLILRHPELWKTVVPDSDPFGYAVTYKERALTYLASATKSMTVFRQSGSFNPAHSSLIRKAAKPVELKHGAGVSVWSGPPTGCWGMEGTLFTGRSVAEN